MDLLSIVPVRTAAERRRFIMFPWRVYRGRGAGLRDDNWVPPLLAERKVFFDPAQGGFYRHAEVQLFLALRGGAVVGTISAHINHLHNQIHNEQIGFFGFFEVLDDPEAAAALLAAAAGWVRERGYRAIRGPMNFSVNDECGLLIEGFDSPPVVLMTYNPPRYAEYLERAGFAKAMDLYAWTIDGRTFLPERDPDGRPNKLLRVAALARKQNGLSVRPFDLRRFDEEIAKGWVVYNQAWARNWGAIPMTEEEFRHLTGSFKPFLDPQIMLMAEVAGQPVGMLVAVPDVNEPLRRINGRLLPFGWAKFLWHKRKIRRMRVMLLGVLPAYRRRGIDALFYQLIKEASQRRGYAEAEMSWILETNDVMNHTIARLGGRRYKTYRVYELPLDGR